jgi:hypothetical protein
MRTKEEWLDFHQFSGVGQALRQLMNYVEFGEDSDGQIIIHTNLTFDSTGSDTILPQGQVVDMDTLECV